MAEIKVKEGLTTESAALRTSGNGVNDGYTAIDSGEVSTLKTSMEYISQHDAIKGLMELYKKLVLKDAADLDSFVEEMKKADEASSSTRYC